MRRAIMAVVRFAGLEPNWRVRLARGYSVVVRLKPGFQLGTIEGGHDFHLKMKWDAGRYLEQVRGYNAGSRRSIDFEAPTSANPHEHTLSIFGAVFGFDQAGQVFYDREGRRENVGELKLPGA
jgi:hypothetical protein